MPRREVREREHLDLRLLGEERCGASGRVAGLRGTLGLLHAERRLVHEQVGAVGDRERHVRRRGVAAQDDLAATARLAEHLAGADLLAAHRGHGLAALEAAEVGAVLYAEARGLVCVEAPGPLV